MDYCFCPHSLTAFRKWAELRYRTLAALNSEWETRFKSWDEVTPLTTFEIKAKEKQALAAGERENFAPWDDHREFMDRTWAEMLGKLRQLVREIDPATPVGIEGLQMPSAWGGYDLWQLSRVVDWIEPYDIGNSREIFRSFMPASAPVLSTTFDKDANSLRRKLWRLVLNGDRGVIFWDDDKNRIFDMKPPDGRAASPLTKQRTRVLRKAAMQCCVWFRTRDSAPLSSSTSTSKLESWSTLATKCCCCRNRWRCRRLK